MDITAGLIAKAGAGAAAVAATTTGVVFKDEISDLLGFGKTVWWTEDTLLEKTGLDCKNNQVCSLESGRKIKIKQNGDTSEEISTLPTSPGKLKLYKDVEGYGQNLKFTVEDGDITLSDSGNVTKLEEDETYEVVEEGGVWILVRKFTTVDAINEKLKNLGLPDECRLDANGSNKDCGSLSDDKLKKINFEGKDNSEVTVTNATGVTLKLAKTDDREIFSDGVKIIFENNAEVTIKKTDTSQVLNWKRGTNPEYKIDGENIKRAWNITKLAKKAGIDCTTTNNAGTQTTSCSFGSSVNIYESADKWITGTKVGGTNVQVTSARGQGNHNQGFKFTIAGTGITLTDGTPKTGVTFKTVNGNTNYEIKEQDVEGGKKWFLSKKN